ncbi:MAG TPA: aminotransferase class III-fold pyridoxal phosphate-dependent enzyme, partial [Lutibacter sp.]|nr:aminotransferase class III-fold pyridoxal phosphate-dependent enzyme [Lutibacter sp.]
MKLEKSVELYTKGKKNLVGAVNSPVRAFKSVGGVPIFIDRAKGSKIIDVDGNEYIDLVLSYGPMILGHRNSTVESAVKKALKKGTTFGASTVGEIKLAKIVCDAFPGMDKVRFVSSGTEAVFSAIRLARAFTGKNKIIKFAGCYHGHADDMLVAAGSGLVTLSIPGSKGVPPEAVANTLVAIYNDIDSVEQHLAKHNDIAA